MPRLWAGGWASSGRRCLLTSRGGTSAAYLAPTACYGTNLVREERQKMGSEGRPGAWQAGAPTASLRAGEKLNPMPRRCTVCDHPERHSIDEALVTGAPYRSVAKQFEIGRAS